MTATASLADFLAASDALERAAADAFAAASTAEALEAARIEFLGDARGKLRDVQGALRTIPKDDKPAAGKRFNALKERLESLFAERSAAVGRSSGAATESVDLTMPGRAQWRGAKHPVTLVIEEIESIFRELGFSIAQGPEVETNWYNFSVAQLSAESSGARRARHALPRRRRAAAHAHVAGADPHAPEVSAADSRAHSRHGVSPRFFDASHAPMFAQIEGLAVDEGVSFVDLKATLNRFAQRFFGAAKSRFRPSFFPFTEPSAEMDIQCGVCGGAGCSVCKGTGWMEILGSGMVHPSVLEVGGRRLRALHRLGVRDGAGAHGARRYGIPDIRMLYDSDVRFLEQIAE